TDAVSFKRRVQQRCRALQNDTDCLFPKGPALQAKIAKDGNDDRECRMMLWIDVGGRGLAPNSFDLRVRICKSRVGGQQSIDESDATLPRASMTPKWRRNMPSHRRVTRHCQSPKYAARILLNDFLNVSNVPRVALPGIDISARTNAKRRHSIACFA